MLKRFLAVFVISAVFFISADEPVNLGRESRIDSVLASVNGEPITLLDVMLESGRDESRLAAMFSGERLYDETAKVRRKIVDEIVVRKLVYNEYKAKPFEIKKQHIEDMVDSIAQTMGDGTRAGLERKLKSYGSTIWEIREKALEKIAVDVLIMEHCERRVFVTPRQIYEHYRNNPGEWTRPAELTLQLLLIRKDTGKDVAAIVKNLSEMLKDADEHTFTRIAKENTEGPNASQGGLIGSIERAKLRQEFRDILKNAEKGLIAGPVETSEGFYFIRVVDVKDELKQPFKDVADKIRRELVQKESEKNREQYREQLLKEAIVRYYFWFFDVFWHK